jgi:hypothetical protein
LKEKAALYLRIHEGLKQINTSFSRRRGQKIGGLRNIEN